jgi:hypothetical protein
LHDLIDPAREAMGGRREGQLLGFAFKFAMTL